MMEVTKGLGDRALANADYYMSIGDDQTASGYQAEYEIWGDKFDHWVAKYDSSGC
jgi:hypothetical protein